MLVLFTFIDNVLLNMSPGSYNTGEERVISTQLIFMLGMSTLDNCFLIPVRINSVFSSFIRNASYHLVFSTHHSMVVMTSVYLLSHHRMTSLCVVLQTQKEKGSNGNPEMGNTWLGLLRHSTVEWRRPSTTYC